MCAFPNNQFRSVRNGFRVTRASPAGNAGEIARWGRKILPQRHQLPGSLDLSRCKKPRFYSVFDDGTAFADPSAGKVRPRHAASLGVLPMLLALGAVSTALDVLQSLTSSKPSSPQSTGFGQNSANPFDFSGNGPASGSPTPPPWSGGTSKISPATLGLLLAAQS